MVINMKFPLEENLPYTVLALIVLAVFYGIYFTKMFIQKRHGIKTSQIGSRKEKAIHTVELLMSIATFGIPAAQLLSIALGWYYMPAGARFMGFCIGMIGDMVFLISVICNVQPYFYPILIMFRLHSILRFNIN